MTARSSRRLLLIGALLCLGLYVMWLLAPLAEDAAPEFFRWGLYGTPAMVSDFDSAWGFFANVVLFLGVMLLTQWAFLRQVRRAALHGDAAVRRRWPVVLSVALVVALLSAGLLATLLELPDWWTRLVPENDRPWGIWSAMLGLWLVWSVVFFVYFRNGSFLGKAEVVVRTLIRGSCLELLIAIPTHAWAYRRGTEDCYCMRGSYTGIAFGVTALLWAFGPGLVLLFLREKQRREPVLQKLCPQCGATLDPAAPVNAPCPSCGRVSLR